MKENLIIQNPESISDELFNSFDPEEELWLIGGSIKINTATANQTGIFGGDVATDYDWTF